MATISLCMIVRDEETVLDRCLSCMKHIADEIIIIDTGSQDRTKEIARQYTDQIYDFPWTDDFSAARNFSFSKATMNYQMWLDADDVISPEDQQALLALKQNLTADVVM
ncbi:MAG: glycosyltransferase family 2 protein, partial [Oscillospiraceae bacterium]|nr:glycosyltransferase family 2 protein [Oscillospiraceae bacterium]